MAETAQLGRPSTFSPELASTICQRLSAGESLRSICDDDDMPPKSTVIDWVLQDRGGFSAQYAHARAIQAQLLADEIFSIADDGSNDWQDTKHGPTVNKEAVQRSALRVDTRKWYLSKVLPKVYGDKLDVTHGGTVGLQLVNDIPRPERVIEAQRAPELPGK